MSSASATKHPKLTRAQAFDIVSLMEDDIHPVKGVAHCLTVIAEHIKDYDSPAYESLWTLSFLLHKQAKELLGFHARLFNGLAGDEPEPPAAV